MEKTVKKLLIIGASSGIGLWTVQKALKQGYAVRAFSRHAEKMRIRHDRLDKVNGNALDAGNVATALKGCDAVIQTLGVALNLKMLTGPVTLFSEATKVLVPAMAEASVNRLIAVTGYGAGESKHYMPLWERPGFNMVFGRAYGDKDKQEDIIKASQLDWTIVRPVVLVDAFGSGGYKEFTDPKQFRNGIISRADVAHFIIKEIGGESYVREGVVLRR